MSNYCAIVIVAFSAEYRTDMCRINRRLVDHEYMSCSLTSAHSRKVHYIVSVVCVNKQFST